MVLCYVGDVQQVVNIVQVNECIVFGDVFDDVFSFLVFSQVVDDFCMLFSM